MVMPRAPSTMQSELSSAGKGDRHATWRSQRPFSKILFGCDAKTKEYDGRTMMRAQEQVAITEATAILKNDGAYEMRAGASGDVMRNATWTCHAAMP